jgi:hypothetical protein
MPHLAQRAATCNSALRCNREHTSETTSPPARDGQADQRACKGCGKFFMPRQNTGGSPQRFCTSGCRLSFHRERQRTQRIGSYAGQPTAPAILGPKSSATQPSEPAVRQLRPWETGVLDIAGCDRTEFVLALEEGEVAGTRPETWPPELRALMDGDVRRWVEENKQTRTVYAITVAAPKYDGIQCCVRILHHSPKG